MVKLVKTIVNEHRKLIGFIVEGKDKELEGFSLLKVQKPLPLKVLVERKFSNNQINVTSNGIQEKGNFKINELPMTAFVKNSFIDIDNKINVIQRFVQNDEVVGFRVKFSDGTEDNFTYPNVLQLSFWFKPENFIVSTSSTGKKFIYGKPGVMKLEELPTTVIGQKKEQPVKKTKSAAQQVQVTGHFNNIIDIIDIYEALGKCDGLVIKLPDEDYVATTKLDTKVASEFIPMGVGEYAFPTLKINETKLNAIAGFRKPGTVVVEFGPGMAMPVQSFTYNDKKIFADSENYIKRFGVAIPKSYEAEFLATFGKTMSVQPIANPKMIQAITSLTGKHDTVFYEIDTNKLDLIAPSKLDSYILHAEQVRNLVDQMFVPRLISKYLSPTHGLIAELKKQVKGDFQAAEGKQPIGIYAGMTEEWRNKIKDAGIDIYTGSFLRKEKVEKTAVNEEVKEKEDDLSVSIDYMIEGRDLKKLTAKVISQCGPEIPQAVIDVVNGLATIKDPNQRLKEAYVLLEKADRLVEDIKRKMWLHKCAMYIKGNKSRVHTHDSDDWVLNTKKKTKAKVYNCVVPGCTDLMIAVLNTEI